MSDRQVVVRERQTGLQCLRLVVGRFEVGLRVAGAVPVHKERRHRLIRHDVARIDRQRLTKRRFDLIRASGDSIQLGEREVRADGFRIDFKRPFERPLGQVDLAASQLEHAHVPVDPAPLWVEQRGLLTELDGALEILETGQRIPKKDERGDIFGILLQRGARARFRVLVLTCHQQEIARLQLSVLVVWEAVGSPQKLRIGAPEVVVAQVRLGELQMGFAGPGRI